jgi:sec-independent protein translocase protein TatA
MIAMPFLLAVLGMGPMELLIIAGVVLLLFGNRLPSVMRSLGRGVIEFKKGVQGIDEDVDEAPQSKP